MRQIIKKVSGYLALAIVLFFALLVVLNMSYTRDLDIPAGLAGRHLEFDGFTLRIAESGAGDQAVVLVHSSLGSIKPRNGS